MKVIFIRREDFGDQMKRGKSSSERWKIFQTYLGKYSVRALDD